MGRLAIACWLLASCAHAAPVRPEVDRAPARATAQAPESPRSPELHPALLTARLADLGTIERLAIVAGGRAILVQSARAIAVVDARSGAIRSLLPGRAWSFLHETRVLVGDGIWDWAAGRWVDLGPRREWRSQHASEEGRWIARVHHSSAPGHEGSELVIVDMAGATQRTLLRAPSIVSARFALGGARLLVAAQPESLLLSMPEGEVLARVEGQGLREVSPELFALFADDRVRVHRLADGGLAWSQPLPQELSGATPALEEAREPGRLVVGAYSRGRYAWDLRTGRFLGQQEPRAREREAAVELAGPSFEVDHDGCFLLRRRPGEAHATGVAPPPAEEEEEDDDHAHEELECAGMVRSPDGSLVAFARESSLYLFDGRTGDPIAAAPEAPSGAVCRPAPEAPFTAGLSVHRADDDTGMLAGCAPPSEEAAPPSESLGQQVIGRSPSRHYALVARAVAPSAINEEDPVPAELWLERVAGRAVRLRHRVSCYGMTGYDESTGWTIAMSCDGHSATVGDDGNTIVLADREALSIIDVRRQQTRRIPFDGDVYGLEPLSARFALAHGAVDALLDVESGAIRASSDPIELDRDRRWALLRGPDELTVIEVATGHPRVVAAAPGERWLLSRDGSALIRSVPSAPLDTITVATGARRTRALPDTFRLTRSALSADARAILGCVEGTLAIASLADDSEPRRVLGVPCTERSEPSFVLDDRFVLLAHALGHTLLRLRDGARLELVPLGIHEGAMAVWAPDGTYFAPPALLPLLRLRESGSVFAAPLSSAAISARYRPDLLQDFLAAETTD